MFTNRKFESLAIARHNEQEMQQISVTPELAASWLELNTNNRPLSPLTVKKYTLEMNAGTWRHPTGEALIFDNHNVIQQGQHRLHAVVQSGKTIQFWVMFNADPDDFQVIDSGKKRTIGDVMSMQGVKNQATVAATTRLLYLHMNVTHSPHGSWDPKKITRSEIINFHQRYEKIIERAVLEGERMRRTVRMSASQFAAVHSYVQIISEGTTQMHEFCDGVATGSMLPTHSPMLALRTWASSPRPVTKNSQKVGVAIITKTWNAFINGASIKTAYFRADEAMPTPLPSQY